MNEWMNEYYCPKNPSTAWGPILAWDSAAVAVCRNICSLIELGCSLKNFLAIILQVELLLVEINQ